MANITINIAKGRVGEWYHLVENAVLANAALILVPIETSGLEADSVLIDKDTLADFLSGATNEQTTMGRKTLTATQLAAVPAPDDANDRFDFSLPEVTWSAATGNTISKILVCFDYDTTAGTDANIVPGTLFDFAATPDGTDITMTTGVFFRAAA